MRFIIGQIMHETNTFSQVPTTLDSFRECEYVIGDEMVRRHRGVRSYIGGMIDKAEQSGIELEATISAHAVPSGRIADEAFAALKRQLLEGIVRAGPFDAVCLALHGAGVTDSLQDIEGDILQAVRKLVGPSMPIAVTLDLHANMTDAMVDAADLMIGDNCYPHIDSYERGEELIELTRRMVDGDICPTMRLCKPPLMMPTIATHLPPVDRIAALCRRFEEEPGIIDCTFYHGFPFSDIYDAGVGVLVTTDNDPALAERVSANIAAEVMRMRGEFYPRFPDPAEGVRLAVQSSASPVVINEMSDNPGGGAPGDGTHLLRALLEAQVQAPVCFGCIYDPEAARLAHASGTGSEIELALGGRTDELHGSPLHVRAYIKTLTDGIFYTSSKMGKGTKNRMGPCARLIVGGIDIIVCSAREQVIDEQIFLLHGIDVREYNIVALKSAHHFRAVFEQLGKRIVTVDSPGLSRADFTAFSFKAVRRPIAPFDAAIE